MKDTFKTSIKTLVPVKLRSRLRATYDWLYRFGIRYQCPFCKSHLRTFHPAGLKVPVLKEIMVVGGGYRLNARCPVCYSHDRERLLYLYLLHKTDIFERPQKVLHVAPEPLVENLLRNQKTVNYLTADLYSNNVMVKMDITNIQFPDNSFDAILCNHVLEHITDDRKAMSELYRTLKAGGWAISQVPISLLLENTYEDFSITDKEKREEVFGQEDHVRIYAKDYKNRLEQVGFKVNLFSWITETENFGGRFNRFGLIKEESVYVATKIL